MSDGDDDRPSADPANAGGYSDEKRALFTSARDAGEWARYARDQAQRDAVDRVFLLLPNRSDTSYYHDVIDQVSLKAEVGPEPVSFDGADANAPFPVIILLFGPPNDDIRAAFDRLGAVLEPVTDIRPTQTDLGDFDRD